MKFDVETISRLAEVMAETGLSELVFENDDTKLKMKHGFPPAAVTVTGAAPAAAAPVAAAPAAASAASAPMDAPANDTAGIEGEIVRSPMVGSVYLQPEPGAPSFVKAGDTVSEGQTLMIVEAMKVMNQIRAPRAGIVAEILVEDGSPVEFDQPLVVIS
ncbi:MAG: acetyl-CoA carboxylase biotin carboxyl carrier protein [Alphaproteobacteria bacterium]